MIRIVLIEDDQLMREWLGRSLSSRGHLVTRYGRADEALPEVVAAPPDVVVSDVHMPGMSGIEFGRVLRARGIDTPLIFITADPSAHLEQEACAVGSRWVLRKPFADIADLWCAVDAAVADLSERIRPDMTATSHALRTPLTAIKMALEGLVARRELDEGERHLAEIAARNLDRLASAVEDHLARLAVADEQRTPLG